jgi:hypothetical protein
LSAPNGTTIERLGRKAKPQPGRPLRRVNRAKLERGASQGVKGKRAGAISSQRRRDLERRAEKLLSAGLSLKGKPRP